MTVSTLLQHETLGKADHSGTYASLDDARDAADASAVNYLTAPVPAIPAATIAAAPNAGDYVSWLSRDRTTIFGTQASTQLRYSTDDGVTWSVNSYVFPGSITAVRDTDDGEMLVACGGSTIADTGALYKSSGWTASHATATFTKVKDASNLNCYFANQWGISVWRNIVVLAEYGSKTAGANARYVYLSRDYGATWTTIFDLGGTTGLHMHGVCYDPYWHRIWISHGDNTNNVYYSDDWGTTWTACTYQNPALKNQVVTIHAMRDCVLFLSDSPPNGVHRVRRRDKASVPMLEQAYLLDSSASITQFGGLIFHARQPGNPVLLSFQVDGTYTGPSILLATMDGYRFHELWRDTITYSGKGLYATVGPTVGGKYLGKLEDGRQAAFSQLTVTAPTWTPNAVLDAYDRNNGQDGVLAPTSRAFVAATTAEVASSGRMVRFVPSKTFTAGNICFVVTLGAGANDEVSVGIYDQTFTLIASSGAVTGKLNSGGLKTVPLTTPVVLRAGVPYYAAITYGTLGGSAANLISANFQSSALVTLFGSTAGTVDCHTVPSHPCPSTVTLNLPTSASGVMLAVRP